MRTGIGAIALAGGAAALAIGLSATSSMAVTAKTWTVHPGGKISGKSGKVTLTDATSGTQLTCASSDMSGTLKNGSGLKGTDIGSITSGAFADCGQSVTFTLTLEDLPWHVNFTSYNSATGIVSGTISHIEVALAAPGCSAVVDGTRGGASDGVVDFTYNPATGQLKILPTGGNLHIYDVSGCFGLFSNGNPATYSATYTVTPRQTIHSP